MSSAHSGPEKRRILVFFFAIKHLLILSNFSAAGAGLSAVMELTTFRRIRVFVHAMALVH